MLVSAAYVAGKRIPFIQRGVSKYVGQDTPISIADYPGIVVELVGLIHK